jgi:acyl-CoA hydrolase
MGRRAQEQPGTTVVAGMLLGPQPWLDAVAAGRLRLRTWHLSGGARRLADRALVEYVPLRLGDVPGLLPGTVDAMVLRVSPPDGGRQCSIGPSGSYTMPGIRAVLASGGTILAEVDPELPRTTGDTLLHLDDIRALVEVDSPTCLYQPAPRLEVHRRIAEAVLELLPHAPTVQLGIGAVPEAIAEELHRVTGGARLVGMAADGIIGLLDGGGVRRGGWAPSTGSCRSTRPWRWTCGARWRSSRPVAGPCQAWGAPSTSSKARTSPSEACG